MSEPDNDRPEEDFSDVLVKEQRKWPVLLELWERKKGLDSKVVDGSDIEDAIDAGTTGLSRRNTANFLKDIIRRKGASSLWPRELTEARIGARQVFGKKRVFEFVPFDDDVDEAFPDRFDPLPDTPVYDIQSLSLPSMARRLGRNEETWLSQVVVHLKIVESHLAFASSIRSVLGDVFHLQTGMKTQPEIDATFIATHSDANGAERHILLACEAKRSKERFLEEQLRFQIRAGMKTTFKLSEPPVDGVKPIGIQLVVRGTEFGSEQLVYVVEFETVTRDDYNERCFPAGKKITATSAADDEAVFGLPLVPVSRALYRVRPSVAGISSDA